MAPYAELLLALPLSNEVAKAPKSNDTGDDCAGANPSGAKANPFETVGVAAVGVGVGVAVPKTKVSGT